MGTDKIVAFTGVLEQNPNDAFARYGLAMEFCQRGENSLAMQQFNELHQRHPDYVPAYQMAAQTLLGLGEVSEARDRLHAGIACARRAGNRHALAEMEGMLDELQLRDGSDSEDAGLEHG